MNRLPILALVLLSVPAVAAADGASPDHQTTLDPELQTPRPLRLDKLTDRIAESSCSNYGIIVQAGANNRYTCAPGDGTCTNYGIIVSVGPGNEYNCQGGHCRNEGVTVNVLGEHCGDTASIVCWGNHCVRSAGADPRAHAGLRAAPCPFVSTENGIEIRCETNGDPCGSATRPLCWTVRSICQAVGPSLSNLTDGTVRCQGHADPGTWTGRGLSEPLRMWKRGS